jgi:transposase
MKQDGRQRDRKTKETIRMMAMKRIQEGEDAVTVVDSFGLCRTTGYKWQKKIYGRGKGLRMLLVRKVGGRPPKLTSNSV